MPAAVIRLDHYSDLQGLRWRWSPYFTPKEMADPTGLLVVVPDFMDWLVAVRIAVDMPMIINDATRVPARQIQKSGRAIGSHVDGMAVDVRVYGERAHRLMETAFAYGVMGIGVYQGPDTPFEKRFIHLDRWTNAPEGLRPRPWSP
jgi:hypothetical protein